MATLGRSPGAAPLTSADIPDNSITAAKIVEGTITVGDIGTNAVGADELANDAVDTNAIADDAVTADKLANSINTAIAANTAKVSFTPDAAQVFNDTGADVDFRVESDVNTHALFVQGSDSNVGIGDTATLVAALSIESDANSGVYFKGGGSASSANARRMTIAASNTEYAGDTHTFNALSAYGRIAFAINSSEKMRINKDGNVGIGTTTPTATLGIETSGNSLCTRIVNTHVDFSTGVVHLVGVRAATDSYKFLECYSGNGNDDEARLTGAGTLGIDGALTQNGVDYAEYFESKTGNAIAVGTTVKLDGNKVVACSEGDTPIGVVRPRGVSSTVGGCSWNKWNQKHLKDDYDAYIFEEYTQTEWEDGLDEDVHPNIVSYQTDMIPADKTVPADATVTSEDEDGNKLMRRKLNPDYDESQTYIPRENRDEWVIVGLLGQIPITKGQPVADSWIKMKDVSETVEMWFVK